MKLRIEMDKLIEETDDGEKLIAVFDGYIFYSRQIETYGALFVGAPAMLRLLEKALPLIVAEADMRDGYPGAPFNQREGYWIEMRELANEVKIEIDLARGQTAEPSDDYHQKIIAQYKADGLCEHGYGFVEYCPNCKD